MGDCFRHSTYTYILYLRCKDAMLVIRCTGLLITITLVLAGKRLNSLILQYDNKSIKLMKRQLRICLHCIHVYMSIDNNLFHAKVFWETSSCS